jgi:hypothetical protein
MHCGSWQARESRSRLDTVSAARPEDECRDEGRAREESEDDFLMMQVQRVEELVYGEKVDIVKHDQEGSCIRPEDDKDRYDRVSSRGSRLLSTNGICPFNLSSEPPIRARILTDLRAKRFEIGVQDAFALANGRK